MDPIRMVDLEAAAAVGLDARDTHVQRICGANKKRPGITSVVMLVTPIVDDI